MPWGIAVRAHRERGSSLVSQVKLLPERASAWRGPERMASDRDSGVWQVSAGGFWCCSLPLRMRVTRLRHDARPITRAQNGYLRGVVCTVIQRSSVNSAIPALPPKRP